MTPDIDSLLGILSQCAQEDPTLLLLAAAEAHQSFEHDSPDIATCPELACRIITALITGREEMN